MTKGFFITFEGGEGTGKSTQCKMLAAALENRGISTLLTREPGGSPGAEEIRNLLVNGDKGRWDSLTEMLLFMAARRNHLMARILPAMNEGKVVICDRFLDSTLAYQGYGYGKKQEVIDAINSVYHLIAGDFYPDLTIVLDIDPVIGLKRSCDRAGNTEKRFESMDISFHKNLRQGFLNLARENPRYAVIDATGSIDDIHQQILDLVMKKVQNGNAV
ncbi:MAG: dTMP kinase [Alphaproteobacteria bacterium]|nr:dTMP kinase [Alphaproteobacteria bacterium]